MASKKISVTSTRGMAGFTIGRRAFEKISAVEGIQPTAASTMRADEFERKGLPPAERRRAIIEAFRPKK